MSKERRIESTDEAELQALAEAWFRARPFDLSIERLSAPEPIPDGLAETLTRNRTWRPQAEEDAQNFLAVPQLLQLGLEVRLLDPLECRSLDGWARCVSPLHVCTTGRDRMDSFQALPTGQDFTWQRVAYEDSRWRIVQFFDQPTRLEFDWFREFAIWQARGRVGPVPERPRTARPGLVQRVGTALRRALGIRERR